MIKFINDNKVYPVKENNILQVNGWSSKWPLCIVKGLPITPDLALDIIKRTDTFFKYSSGNNKEFISQAEKILQIPQEDIKSSDPSEIRLQKLQEYLKAKKKYCKINEIIAPSLTHFTNNYISSSYIGGYYGWVHLDGTIGNSINIGKWPTAQEILTDLIILASTFPYLEVTFTIVDSEIEPVKSTDTFYISRGTVGVLKEPIPVDQLNLKEGQEYWGSNELDIFNNKEAFICNKNENKFTLEELASWKMKPID